MNPNYTCVYCGEELTPSEGPARLCSECADAHATMTMLNGTARAQERANAVARYHQEREGETFALRMDVVMTFLSRQLICTTEEVLHAASLILGRYVTDWMDAANYSHAIRVHLLKEHPALRFVCGDWLAAEQLAETITVGRIRPDHLYPSVS